MSGSCESDDCNGVKRKSKALSTRVYPVNKDTRDSQCKDEPSITIQTGKENQQIKSVSHEFPVGVDSAPPNYNSLSKLTLAENGKTHHNAPETRSNDNDDSKTSSAANTDKITELQEHHSKAKREGGKFVPGKNDGDEQNRVEYLDTGLKQKSEKKVKSNSDSQTRYKGHRSSDETADKKVPQCNGINNGMKSQSDFYNIIEHKGMYKVTV